MQAKAFYEHEGRSKAQLRNPSKGDWVHLIKSDLNDFEINENLEQISKLGKNKFKKKVAIACKKFTLKKLLMKKDGHEKGQNLHYNQLKMNRYFSSDKFSTSDAKFLFKIRAEMLNVKKNFPHHYENNLFCQHCPNNKLQSQEHIPLCDVLNEKVQLKYENLLGSNLSKIKIALEKYQIAWDQWTAHISN